MDICSGKSLQKILDNSLSEYIQQGPILDKIWTYALLSYLLTAIILTYYISKGKDKIGLVKVGTWFFVLLVGAIAVQIPNLAVGYMHVDESQHIGEAIKLSQDARFWHSVDGTTVGPISIFIPAVFIWLGVDLDYATIRIINILLWSLIAITGYRTLLLFVNEQKSLWYTLLLFSVFPFFYHADYVSYNGEIAAALLLSLILYYSLLALEFKSKSYHIIVLGVLLVIAPLTKLQVGPVALLTGIAILYFLKDQRKLQLMLVLSSFLTVLLLLAYLVINGVLEDFIESYIVNNLLYTSTGIGLKVDKGWITRIFRAPFILFYLIEVRHIFSCLFFVGVLYAKMRFKTFGVFTLRLTKTTFCVIFLVSILFVILAPGHNYYHYTILAVPTSVLLVSVLFENIFLRYEGYLSLFVGFIVIPQAVMSAFEDKKDFSTVKNSAVNYSKNLEISRRLCAMSKANQKVALWGYDTYIYSETDLVMGTRDAQTHRHALAIEQREYYINRFVSDMKENNPEFFIDTTKKNDFLFDFQRHNYTNFPAINSYILENYNFVQELNGAQIFARKDLNLTNQLN